MKKYIATVIACFSLVSPAALPAVAFAVETVNEPGQSTTTSTLAEDKTTNTPVPPDDQVSKEGRKKRLESYKLGFKTKLDEPSKKRIGERCVAAQSAVDKVSTRQETAVKGRSQAYSNIVERLQKLVESLKLKNIDTAELESQIVILETKIEAFNTTYAAYKTAVSDTAKTDCKADVVAFKAALEKSRSDQKLVVVAAQAVRSYVKDSIKPTLQNIKQQLQAAKPVTAPDASGTDSSQ